MVSLAICKLIEPMVRCNPAKIGIETRVFTLRLAGRATQVQRVAAEYSRARSERALSVWPPSCCFRSRITFVQVDPLANLDALRVIALRGNPPGRETLRWPGLRQA